MSLGKPITKEILLEKMRMIDGLLSNEEAKLLYELAREAVNGIIVEIGSYKGKSTICLAHGVNDGFGVRVYAIDPHMGDLSYHEWELDKNAAPSKKEFKANIEVPGLRHYIYPLYMTSKEAYRIIEQPITLLFIDGDHRFESVLADYKNWKKKLIVGGIMAFHDSFSWEGVIKTVDDYVFKDPEFVCLGFSNSITYFQKIGEPDWVDKLNNWFWLRIRKIYIRIIFMHLPPWIIKPLKNLNRLVMKILAR